MVYCKNLFCIGAISDINRITEELHYIVYLREGGKIHTLFIR